ncbi:hypothetical protein [Nocardia wallacei]|uniref:hypothetical protein n=1 Tax=Nocardia wallacei TaxID=480035 RepID=UPI0024553181|nr:hypothetical protein [Nocardia wallacei]
MSDTQPPRDDGEPGFNTGAVLGFLIGFICCAVTDAPWYDVFVLGPVLAASIWASERARARLGKYPELWAIEKVTVWTRARFGAR